MTHVRYRSLGFGSAEPALAAVDGPLLATTQNDLATGNKVNTALDNPTEFFTAQGLNNRASDINNLLDGIGNGVQVLQAANNGITSLQSLIASAQSIANQVLQAPTGYTTKSNVTSAAIPGATANNLLGPNINATATGTAVTNRLGATPTAPITASTLLVGGAGTDSLGTPDRERFGPAYQQQDHHLRKYRRPRRQRTPTATSRSVSATAARRP